MSSKDIEDWNRIANAYMNSANSGDFVNRQFTSVLWESLGSVQDLQVLDLGCGAGWLSHEMSEAGAKVIGIDGSIELVKAAQISFPDIHFMDYDLSQGLPTLNCTFDRIIANMVLMDIPDLTDLIAAVRQVLAPRGKFIFTMQHPCFFNIRSERDAEGQLFKKLTRYLQPEVWRMESFGGHNHYHRSLTFYFDHLRQNGMAVTRLYEPKHVSHTQRPEADQNFFENIPIFIFIEAMAL